MENNLGREEVKVDTVETEEVYTAMGEAMYPVLEIFSSIQGEGCFMGMPVTFIRMAECNLKCTWCDTKESWGIKNAKWMTADDIVAQIDKPIVVITGGEPCLRDLEPLIEVCHDKYILVNIETNGTLPTPTNADWVTCSPKPPLYTIHERCNFNELKYIVDDEFDPETCVPLDNKEVLQGMVWLHPESCKMESAQRAFEYTMKYKKFRLGVQLHKVFDIK